ncbi:DUF2927 domain-containing protein [Marinomonas algicola]|uniref:DUF2927 domain-containing protein n=1 Tax=Marinomonas algicola TaxID=2773454 RepID=UPI00174A2E06|nr:DUF2927 domain-containing protein [Marinomonas algicola]
MLTNSHTIVLQTLFSFCLLVASLNTLAIERWQDARYLQKSFITIALEREYDKKTDTKLVRWERPIYVFLESDYGDTRLQKELLSVHLDHLSSITGVPISYVNSKQDANIFIIFTSYKQLEPKVKEYIGNPEKIRAAIREAICLGNFSYNQRSEITKGTIIIPVDYARQKARFLDCIIEEITQLMGLPNDSDDVFPSIFNDKSIDSYLSPLDYLLLKLLYSNYLTPGMTVQDTKRALPLAIRELLNTGDLRDAARRVRKGSLQEYIGD